MLEHTSGVFVSHALGVNSQFLYGICIEITSVAAQLDGCVGGISEFMFVAWSTFFNVVDEIQLLDVFVSFTVQLEVGLQIRLVVA